jgi:hypothetical protein
MKVIFAQIADAANVSNGKFNLLGLFETIYVHRFPATHSQMALAVTLQPESLSDLDKKHPMKVRVVDANFKPIWDTKESIVFEWKLDSSFPREDIDCALAEQR